MKRLFFICFACLTMALSAATTPENYTVIISMDGFRWDYAEAFDTPFFDSVGAQGVKAVMRPSFPSKTFPNHYTLATGLVPDHHGIVANGFYVPSTGKTYSLSNDERYDASYYGGDPIWLTAKRQGVTTATVYWVGSDVPVKGDYATYWNDYAVKPLLSFAERTDRIIDLLTMPEAERPHLIMAYFEQPDYMGHAKGPITAETRREVENLDSLLATLWKRIEALPIGKKVNLILTSDHGMAFVLPGNNVPFTHLLKPEWYKKIEGNLPAMIYCNPGCEDKVADALRGLDHARVWKRNEIPARLQYGSNPRVGDVIVLPDPGFLIQDKEITSVGGAHGYDNMLSDMHVMFRAMGPDFKQGYVKADRFPNTSIYPLLAHLLGVKPSPCDGTIEPVLDLLK